LTCDITQQPRKKRIAKRHDEYQHAEIMPGTRKEKPIETETDTPPPKEK